MLVGLSAAAVLALRTFVLEDLGRLTPRIESVLADRLGVEVRIEGLSGHLEGLSPAVSFTRLALDDGRLLVADGVAAVMDWRGLLRGRLRFETLHVQRIGLTIERVSDLEWRIGSRSWRVDPAAMGPSREPTWRLPGWLTAQGDLLLREVGVRYRDRRAGEEVFAQRIRVDAVGSGASRRIAIRVPAVDGFSGPMAMHANLQRQGRPDALADARWDGRFFVEAGAIDAARLSRLVGGPVAGRSGSIDVRGWTEVAGNRIESMRLTVGGRDLALRANDAEVVLPSAHLDLDVQPRASGAFTVSAREAWATDRKGTRIEVGPGPQTLTVSRDGHPQMGQFSLRGFDAARLLDFARELPFPADMRAVLSPLRASGRVESLSLWFDASAPRSRYELHAAFSNLTADYRDPSVAAPRADHWDPRLPGFENITGTLAVTERDGALDISASEAVVRFPGVFAEPRIALDRLDAEVGWKVQPVLGDPDRPDDGRRRPPVVDVDLRRIVFANAHGSGTARGRYRTAPDSLGEIDLRAELADLDVREVHRYLPLTMIPKVRGWFRQALRGGRSERATLELRGNLRDFPFRPDGSGEFDLRFAVRDGRLRYGPDWPELRDYTGDVRIRRGGMQATVERGRIFSMPVASGRAVIPDFRTPLLEVEGRLSGPGQDLVRFLAASPLHGKLGDLTTQARIDGAASTRLLLRLPLTDFDAFTLAGSSRLEGATVQVSQGLPRLTDVHGEVRFSETGIAFDGLQARLFDGPVRLDAQSPRRGDFRLQLQGTMGAQGLRRHLPNPLTARLRGESRYRADLALVDGKVEFTARSNLAGLESRLPVPFDKPAVSPRLFEARLEPRLARSGRLLGDRLRVRLGDEASLVFERIARPGRWQLRRGALAFGTEPVLPDEGFAINGRAPVVDGDGWSTFIADEIVPFARRAGEGREAAEGYFAGFDLNPRTVSLIANSVRFAQKDFNAVVVGASREGATWRANLSTRELDGYLSFQPDDRAGRLAGRFSRFHVPPDAVGVIEDVIDEQAARMLPDMDIVADDFRLGDRPLGRLRLLADRGADPHVWRIHRLSMEMPTARLAASGRWRNPPGSPAHSLLDFDMDVADAGGLLAVMGFPETVAGGAGKIQGRLGWSGSPLRVHPPSLHGNVTMSMQKGQFLKAEPGIAKLIGVLSLQSIPRRLSLDFSDVFEKGFAFDAIVGEATLTDGVARTENLLMHGVQAQVLINGQVDVARETQQLSVDVLPNINAGIASIAYAAVANPAVGIGTLLAQMLLEKPLRRLFAYEFAISGPWTEPEVVQTNKPDHGNGERPEYISG